ncbi:MAG: adenylate/guanylate cyclase domain-containing protein [Cyanobacteriota bacterium]
MNRFFSNYIDLIVVVIMLLILSIYEILNSNLTMDHIMMRSIVIFIVIVITIIIRNHNIKKMAKPYNDLIKKGIEMQFESSKEDITIIYCGIEPFTYAAENPPSPEKIMAFVNDYLSSMTDIIVNHNGTVENFIGESILAFYSAKYGAVDHQMAAINSARQMLKKIKDINSKWSDMPELKLMIGIDSGVCIVGNVGSDKFSKFTVMGTTVNNAERFHSLNRHYQTKVILSINTLEPIKEEVTANYIEELKIKGKPDSIKIYSLENK